MGPKRAELCLVDDRRCTRIAIPWFSLPITSVYVVRRPNAIELRKEGCVAVTREMHPDIAATSV